MQNVQSPTSKHSNVERQKGDSSKLMSNSVRSHSSQIELHQDNKNAELELQLQEVTSSPAVPPGFKAAAAAAAEVAATVAAMTSVHPYVANFNRGYAQSSTTAAARESLPTATLHYMPTHQQNGQLLQSQTGLSQQQPQHGLLPQRPLTGQSQPPRNAAPSQQVPPHGATQPPHNAAPSQKVPPHGAAPPMIHHAKQHSERQTAEQPQGQYMGHNLPVAVMPVRQPSLPTVLGQQYAINKRLYATGNDPGTDAQTSAVAANRPPASYALPPMPPMMHHLSSGTSKEMSEKWGPMMQGQKICHLPPKNRRSPYTPTWHLQGPPSVGNAHRAYVKNIPPTSTVGSRMGHMAPPPHQFAPPQPQPSGDQQLLVLTPFNQSMRGTALNTGRHSTPTATEGGLQTRMPPHHPPPYPYMPPPPLQWP